MAKETERQRAQIMYVDQCLTAKEISTRLKVSEKSIGKWVEAGNWKQLRVAKQTGPASLIAKYSQLLDMLLDKRLKLEHKDKRTDQEDTEYRGIIDEMSKLSAMIERVQKDGQVSLKTHIYCIERFTGYLMERNPQLATATIEYQQEYLPKLATDLAHA